MLRRLFLKGPIVRALLVGMNNSELELVPLKSKTPPKEILKISLIIEMKDEWIETLKIWICDPLSRMSRIAGEGVMHAEIDNLLENFKTDILSTLSTKLDVFQVKNKQAKEEELLIFYPCCQGNHGHKEFPLDIIEVCTVYTKNNSSDRFPSPPGLKVIFKEDEEEIELTFFME